MGKLATLLPKPQHAHGKACQAETKKSLLENSNVASSWKGQNPWLCPQDGPHWCYGLVLHHPGLKFPWLLCALFSLSSTHTLGLLVVTQLTNLQWLLITPSKGRLWFSLCIILLLLLNYFLISKNQTVHTVFPNLLWSVNTCGATCSSLEG